MIWNMLHRIGVHKWRLRTEYKRTRLVYRIIAVDSFVCDICGKSETTGSRYLKGHTSAH